MKSTPSPFPYQRTLLSIAVAIALGQYGAALAAPTGHQVVAGQVTVTRPDLLQTVISQASQGAIVNWQSFSVGASERVDIRQPNASSVLLNRVIGNNPSEIYGRLSANGQVFLVNPNGVLFGRDAQVSVGGLVASTLDIANDDFLSGRFHFAGNSGAAVENFGQLQAAERGTVALLGGRVNNDGTISARLGTVALSAGGKIALDFEGDGLTKIRVEQGAVAAMVENRGMIIADGGQAVMSARAAQALADTVLNQQGVVRARSLVERDGKIVLDGGSHGVTLNSGTLDATGGAGLTGGVVNVLGHHVGLVGNALIDASGDAGGGQVFVGGGVQGGDPLLRHAAATFASAQTTLRADALGRGDGGTVVLWSDGATRMFGAASAMGGALGGNGGLIETSGKTLSVAGMRADAAAARGRAGTWLLDPYNIDIVDSPSGTPLGSNPDFVSDTPSSQLSSTAIDSALDKGTSVTVTTGPHTDPDSAQEGSINVYANITKSSGGDAALTLNAAGSINIASGVRIGSSSGALQLDLNADADHADGGNINIAANAVIASNGGNVRLFGQGDPVNGFATGMSSNNVIGVYLGSGASIDTTALLGGGSGNIMIRGKGLQDTFSGPGVTLDSAILLAGAGSISVTGIGGPGGAGLSMLSPTISTNGGGAIDLRGLAVPNLDYDLYGNGIYADDGQIFTTGGPGNIVLSGEAVGASGIALGGMVLGSPGMSGNITLRAFNTATSDLAAPMLALQGPIETSGVLALRPGGVSATGELTRKDAVPINLGDYFSAGPPPDSFTVNELILGEVVHPRVQAVVLGGDTHTGLIDITTRLNLGGSFDLTLQNGGAGSAGIALSNDLSLPGRTLVLSTGGGVTQAGAITADGLLLHGSQAQSNFILTNTGNSVATLNATFDQPKGVGVLDGDVRLVNNGALQLGPLSGAGFDANTNLAQVLGNAESVIAGDLDIQSTGDLTLAQPLNMMGSNVLMALRTDNDLFVNGALNAYGSNSSMRLAATRDIAIAGAINLNGANGALTVDAGRALNAASSSLISTLGSDSAVTLGALAGVTLDASISMQGQRSSLTVNAVDFLTTSGNIDMVGSDALLRLNADGDITTNGALTLTGANSALALETVVGDVTVFGPVNMTGSNALLRLSGAGDVVVGAAVDIAGGTNVQRVNAGRNILLGGGTQFFSSAGGPLNLDLNADADDLNGGAIAINGGASIFTQGGALRLYGQGDAATGYASGSTQSYADGIRIGNASINTGSGALTMRGRGNQFFPTDPPSIVSGTGVSLNGAAIASTSGALSITGMGAAGGDGVALRSSTVASSAGGAIDMRGRSGPVSNATLFTAGTGLSVTNSTIVAGGAGRVQLSGESAGASGIVLSGSTAIGGSAATGNIVLRAFNTASSAEMLSLGGTIQTGGVVNLRPGGVTAAGLLTEQLATMIQLGGPIAAGQFSLSAPALDAAMRPGSAGVVIGSAAQSGAITTALSAPLSGRYNLTLQNDAPGSGGISLQGVSNPGAMLTFSSGGAVSQSGPVVAGSVLLRGTQPQARFTLTHTGNAINVLSATFLQPRGAAAGDGDVHVYSSGNLLLGPLSGVGFDGATNLAQNFSTSAATVVAGDLTLNAGGDLNVAGGISMLANDATAMLGAGRDITLGASIAKAAPAGALQVNLNADADGVNGGAIVMAPLAAIATNGGSVIMYGQSNAAAGYASGSAAGISVSGTIDTRGTGGNGGATLRGRGLAGSGVAINGAAISSGAGAVNVSGQGGAGGAGVQIGASQITTSGGAIDLRGRSGADSGASLGAGIVASGSTVRSATGAIALAGEAFGGAGLALLGGTAIGGAATTGNIVLRASNTSSARTLDANGPIQTAGVLNIRPGGVSASGALTEATGSVINIGASATAGEFSMPQDVFVSGIAAGTPTVIVGSAAQSGAIHVQTNAALGGTYDLTLQTDGAGSGGISLYNGLSIPGRMLTLSSGGSVNQGAAIVAGRLLLHGTQAQSSFQLMDAGNAIGRFSARFEVVKGAAPTDGDVNLASSGNLDIGPLTALGFDGASGQTQSFVAANAVIAGDIVAQAGASLSLLQNVSTLGSDITLVAGGVLLNPANATLNPGGGGRWRVFANTWIGEVDGGLTGTAPAANFYNCLFGAGCMSLLPAKNNYFVYRQQPVLNVALDTPTQTRLYGTANPAFPFTASGLVNGDALATSLAGAYTVPAANDVGSYAVPGAFSSPLGYLVNAVPGTLNVAPVTLTYVANPASRPAGRVNPAFSGAVTGLVGGDTLASATTGALGFTSTAPVFTATGQYPINGGGLSARNYVFQQAPSNLTALSVTAALALMPSITHDVSMPSSDLYGANFGMQRACVGSGSLAGASGAGDANDSLAMEWSRVRQTPNLSNCIGLAQRYSCGDF
ncbi:MBG domain-containing protein [Massilia sp. TSP1-1-2]|uniref:two-partner secretion domain-containing protein n=1 Tax=Massilia sp. TSP1-1-2 TaxID=2804649 RepID=UPI003CEF76F0